MNTKSLLTRIAVPVLSLGLLGGLGATLATSAGAAVKPVTANTHLNNHPDTTNVSGPATVDSPGGPVWAYDNATEKFTMVQTSANTWDVTVDYVGSFHGFADPKFGTALDSNGSVKGTITYQVTSPNAPDPSLLPGQSASDAHISDNIRTLFGLAPTAPIGGGDVYNFSYQNGNYVQNADPALTITGDVTGH